LQNTLREAMRELCSWSSKDAFTHGYGCPVYFSHPFAHSAVKRVDGVLPFIEEEYILSMRTKLRETCLRDRHYTTKNLTGRFVTPDLFPHENFIFLLGRPQQGLFLKTINRETSTGKKGKTFR
jgi:hypothetical protein